MNLPNGHTIHLRRTLTVSFLLLHFLSYGQLKHHYEVEGGGVATTAERTPFWLRANQWGSVPEVAPFLTAQSKIYANYAGDSTRKKRRFEWGYGSWLVATAGQKSQLLLPEAFLKLRYGKLELWAGRRRQVLGLVGDSLLTSGSYIESGNALPLPRVQIGFMDYFPLLKGIVAFKGFVAHGWFDANPVVKNHYLHQKTLYLRLGKPGWPVRLYGGLNHNAQWGGKVLITNQYTVRDQLPSDWIDYWYVASGKRIPTFGYVDPAKYDAIDRGNRIGNHLGTFDVGVEIKNRSWNLLVYRQNIYDDGSLFYLANVKDGLNGITWTNSNVSTSDFYVKKILIEYLGTANQGGDIFSLDGGPRGRDNYFNHAQYKGWEYEGKIMGTPFITHETETKDELPRTSALSATNNNRVRMLHLGLMGGWSTWQYIMKLSYSQNLGTYGIPFPPDINQFSALTEVLFPLQHRRLGSLRGKIAVAADLGQLYPTTFGVYLGIRKTGIFR